MAVASKLPGITASFRGAADIAPYRFVEVASGSAADVGVDGQAFFAKQAQAESESVIGVTGIKGIAAQRAGEVVISGIALVEAGGVVAGGDLISSDSQGRAAAGGNVVCAIAITGGVEGSVVAVKLGSNDTKGESD